jgi:predicted nucleotidyltransferase
MELTRNVLKWGNSAGVLLPKEWIGKEAKIILIDRTLQIRKEAFDILKDYLEDILGIYLVGSYARNEQTKDSDIDIIAISKNVKKEIVSGKYHVSITPLESIKKTLKKNPLFVLPRILEAKTIVNNSLLGEIKSFEVQKKSFNNFIDETKRIIKINDALLKMQDEYPDLGIVYSLILRLRGIFLIKKILKKKEYSNNLFLKWLSEELGEDAGDLLEGYKIVKENRTSKIKISIQKVKALLELLKKEVTKW